MFFNATVIIHNTTPLRCACAKVCPALCALQISELSVDVESKQKELQSLQHDKSCLEQQLINLVRTAGRARFLR